MSADRRIAEMIDRWLASIELHLKYATLDDEAYRQIQPWPPHDRPNRWILELARQKLLELKSLCETRQAMGDAKFAEALDHTVFLANLVGLQNVKRYIPLADPAAEKPVTTQPKPSAPAQRHPKPRPSGDEATREMPRLDQAAHGASEQRPQKAKVATGHEATREMPRLHAAAAPKNKSPAPALRAPEPKKPAARQQPAAAPDQTEELQEKVVADAVRLLKWGRQWHELAELIARMADRPSVSDVRKLLRTKKNTIDAQLQNAR